MVMMVWYCWYFLYDVLMVESVDVVVYDILVYFESLFGLVYFYFLKVGFVFFVVLMEDDVWVIYDVVFE